MKLDGVTMDTMEPTEAAAIAEPSESQDNVTEQAPSQTEDVANEAAASAAAQKANDKQVTADPKVKPNSVANKSQPKAKTAGAAGSNSRPGTAPHNAGNNVKSSKSVSSAVAKKTTATMASKASTAGAPPKRPLGASAASSIAKNQTRVPDKKPVGPTRTTSAATVTNGTKPVMSNCVPKKKTETVNATKPKTTVGPPRPAASAPPKPSTPTAPRNTGAAASRMTRPATAPSTSRPAPTTSRPTTATTKPITNAAAKSTAPKVAAAPSTGRTTAAQPSRPTAAAKKDVGRPPSASLAKKPPSTTTSAAAKKPEPSKPTASVKVNSAFKSSGTAKPADSKVSQPKSSQPAKTATTKPVASVRSLQSNKPPLGRTPPASPASKPIKSSTSQPKPTQAVLPSTAVKKTKASKPAVTAAVAAVTAVTAVTAVAVSPVLTETSPEGLPPAASTPEEASPQVVAQDTLTEKVPQEPVQAPAAAPSPPLSPVSTDLTETSPDQQQLEDRAPSPTSPDLPPASTESSPPLPSPVVEPVSEEPVPLSAEETPSTPEAPQPEAAAAAASTNAVPQIVCTANLNEEGEDEDEDEEEREGSQLVSVSEMSGATQPTEESRPGSAGLAGGAAWRASGALLSELDSEDVSGSQVGASELSAPGVLEGTESIDDLGDGSLKGAMDMEGASAGSPDFEKVPDIPVNDFEEDEDEDDDDNDRVCDMDVGSERTDESRRPRHDNDVDDEEDDEDVEMASEGVTESGLESYGNADEDDFADDERLDNLNRVAQPPPPPPLLPSAPAAQWDQPNPFADHWVDPLHPQQFPEPVGQVAGAGAASPSSDPFQADSETPTQTPAQTWMELGSAAFVLETQESSHQSCQSLEAQMQVDPSSPALMQTLNLTPASAQGMSVSSTVSSETSTPEELCDNNQHPPGTGSYSEPDPSFQLDTGAEDREEEAETLPADEVLGGSATAPTSNPSSSSVTEDEASDTEGEAQLDDSVETPAVGNITFIVQPSAQRCLSTVEEGEEAETEGTVAGEDSTPPSATSLASYGFDTMTTASNSNAPSTGESCIKSPGVFSLEELPEEAKEPCLDPQSGLSEQPYIECGKQDPEPAQLKESTPGSEEEEEEPSEKPEEIPDDIQPPYYAICEKTENSFAGFTALLPPHHRDHAAYPRNYCDFIKPHGPSSAPPPPKLTCADLPPRNPGQQALSPQLRRLEQHQRQLLELQHRREQQSRPLEEAEQERKRREEEEERKKKDEAEEEIKRNKEKEEEEEWGEPAALEKEKEGEEEEVEDLKQRRELELQLQQQQEELKQRQQIMQWQQELQLSPSSGLCTIYEALESSDEEEAEEKEGIEELPTPKKKSESREQEPRQEPEDSERLSPNRDIFLSTEDSSLLPDLPETASNSSQDEESSSSPCPAGSPERPPPLELDWGKKVDIVQQLINQTLLLNGDSCSSLLLMPGGSGGTLSPLESSLWPTLLPPLTPPSATVTSVSSFSPETAGSSPQGEWTVVELETHH